MQLASIKKTFWEDIDTGAPEGDANEITVESVNNGVANYLVISTQRWAIDEGSLEELVLMLKEMMKEVNDEFVSNGF